MAINLDQTYVDPKLEQNGQRVFGPLLENLQCNVLKSHGRQWAFHIFLRFTGEPDAVRAWIKNFASQYVTSAATQLQQSEVFKARQQAVLDRKSKQLRLQRLQADLDALGQQGAGAGEVAPSELTMTASDGGQVAVQSESTRLTKELAKLDTVAVQEEELVEDELIGAFFLSAEGYKYLGFDVNDFGDNGARFRDGMKDQDDGFIGDLVENLLDTSNKDPKPGEWEVPYQGTIHAMVLLARDWENGEAVYALINDEVVPSLGGIAEVVTIERGHVLRNDEAQAKDKDEALSEGKGSGKGQPIEHFGYVDGRSQPLFLKGDIDKEQGGIDRWDPTAPLSLVLVPDPFADVEDSYGSYFVFRKLEQDVPAFNEDVVALADTLDVPPDLAGALAVGRFKDGTPVTLQRMDGLRDVNNFEYEHMDSGGHRCPAHAHIRKVNPRGTTPLTSLEDERKRRIVRRGIPYGEREDVGTSPVGLLFMCYQSNIKEQFEFIQRTWADNPNFPDHLVVAGTGDDPIIGQDTDANAGQDWPKHWGESGRDSFNFGGYVKLRGGEYFFAPSITFLNAI
jgi:Dyp-type peroxidase family